MLCSATPSVVSRAIDESIHGYTPYTHSWGHVWLYTDLLKAYTHILMGIICQINTLYMDLFIYDYSTGPVKHQDCNWVRTESAVATLNCVCRSMTVYNSASYIFFLVKVRSSSCPHTRWNLFLKIQKKSAIYILQKCSGIYTAQCSIQFEARVNSSQVDEHKYNKFQFSYIPYLICLYYVVYYWHLISEKLIEFNKKKMNEKYLVRPPTNVW